MALETIGPKEGAVGEQEPESKLMGKEDWTVLKPK
jgi:hypothetical protein